MIELLYFASQIQCASAGAFLNVKVDVYQNQALVKTMMVNESVLLPVDSVKDLTFKYSAINNNTNCSLSTPSEIKLGKKDQVPNIPGVYQQQSIQTMLNGLNDYEELFLVELGTANKTSAAFDLQDVVFKVNNNPLATIIYPD